ncbi:hypothetical protein [Couchioplanes azureus]|uniref:hypothetical protein n=1 Tax=Couchioplanes caeruleus TaxID=56438 RepID=UPI00166F6820|nr:hypothetical protein [Couchioplanes caeruleus]GGQ77133.1 hypothetical protein GCM10010166_53850 [Couchioplanes caeruleus subsp. azureus]
MAKRSDDHRDGDPASERMPRWVRVLLVVVGVLVLAVVAHQIFGGGQHGPNRHVPAGGLGAVLLMGPLG